MNKKEKFIYHMFVCLVCADVNRIVDEEYKDFVLDYICETFKYTINNCSDVLLIEDIRSLIYECQEVIDYAKEREDLTKEKRYELIKIIIKDKMKVKYDLFKHKYQF